MALTQIIKNIIGDTMGEYSCPVSGDTLWHAPTVSVKYAPGRKVLISESALKQFPADEIASVIAERASDLQGFTHVYDQQMLAERIPAIRENYEIGEPSYSRL